MATIAELDIVLGLKNAARVQRNLKNVGQSVDNVDRSTRRARASGHDLQRLYRGAMATGALLVAKDLFTLGQTVEETGSKFSTVFGESERDVQQFIDSFATMAGMSETQAKGILGTTGAIAQGLGFVGQEAAQLSTQAVQLAGDLASFNNVPIERTANAITSAMTGEREALKGLGIVLRETDVQQRAFANSGKTSAAALTSQERATATMQLITERAGVAVGDLARTQDSAANKTRALVAELQNVRETLATSLLPVFSVGVEGMSRFISGIQIMGAEAAVLVARFNFWKEAALGTEESTMRANDVLREMRIAAEAVKLEVVGLTFNLDQLAPATVTATGAAARLEITERNVAASSAQASLGTIKLAADLKMLELGAGAAADETERLHAAQSKIGAVTGALGFLSGAVPGLGFLTQGVSLFSGASGAFSGLSDAFKRESGGPVNAGTAYMVGEAGAEMFVPETSGTIVPNGGITVNVPPARDPITFARDAQWQRAILETFRALEGNGFKAATA